MLRSAATLPASGSVTTYHHHDGLGSVIMLTNAGGSVVERYRYDVFGHVTILDAAHAPRAATAHNNRFLFTGREWLAQLELYDYRNRTYSPNLGRFLQTDPIRFEAGDLNLYRYVGNTVLNMIDPYGLCGFLGIKEPVAPMPECPSIEGFYRHCVCSCILNRLLTAIFLPTVIGAAYAPHVTAEFALIAGQDKPTGNDSDFSPNRINDIHGNWTGIGNSYKLKSCYDSCAQSLKEKHRTWCCQEKGLLDKDRHSTDCCAATRK